MAYIHTHDHTYVDLSAIKGLRCMLVPASIFYWPSLGTYLSINASDGKYPDSQQIARKFSTAEVVASTKIIKIWKYVQRSRGK
jgi:hypothetical protein